METCHKEGLVSVVIPSYNRARIITKSIKSVLNQTYKNIEVIVVDDGSSDGTRFVIAEIKDKRIRYIRQENSGACAARNNGIAHANGEYIALHDSDDTWFPEKIEKQLKAMKENDADIVICKILMHTQPENIIYPKRIPEGFVSVKQDLFGIGSQTILAKREVFENIQFDTLMPRYQDLEWVFRAIRKYKMYCINDVLVNYFVGEDSISVNNEKLYQALDLFLGKHSDIRTVSPKTSLHAIRNLLFAWKEEKEKGADDLGKYLKLSFSYRPNIFDAVKESNL